MDLQVHRINGSLRTTPQCLTRLTVSLLLHQNPSSAQRSQSHESSKQPSDPGADHGEPGPCAKGNAFALLPNRFPTAVE